MAEPKCPKCDATLKSPGKCSHCRKYFQCVETIQRDYYHDLADLQKQFYDDMKQLFDLMIVDIEKE